MKEKISPSLICMDLLEVGRQLEIMNRNADYLHIDIMDGQFVPVQGLYPGFVGAVRRGSRLPLDCHLMVKNPLNYIESMSAFGADTIVPHAEAMATGAFRVIDRIKECGCRAGVAVNPATPLSTVYPYIKRIERLTIMTIEPGYPGSPFIWEMIEKVREAARLRCELGLNYEIEMDGSLCDGNLRELRDAGCDVFVAGTASLFGRGEDLEQSFHELRQQFN